MDDLTTLFIKKVNALESLCADQSNDKQAIQAAIIALRNYLASNRYITQHRTCQAFLTYLWRHDGNYKTRDGFVAWVKCKVNFADINITTANVPTGKKTDDGHDILKEVEFRKYLPWSLSFGSCSQRKHGQFVELLKAFAMSKYSVDFDSWLTEYENNPELV